jgi:hypothetical protein
MVVTQILPLASARQIETKCLTSDPSQAVREASRNLWDRSRTSWEPYWKSWEPPQPAQEPSRTSRNPHRINREPSRTAQEHSQPNRERFRNAREHSSPSWETTRTKLHLPACELKQRPCPAIRTTLRPPSKNLNDRNRGDAQNLARRGKRWQGESLGKRTCELLDEHSDVTVWAFTSHCPSSRLDFEGSAFWTTFNVAIQIEFELVPAAETHTIADESNSPRRLGLSPLEASYHLCLLKLSRVRADNSFSVGRECIGVSTPTRRKNNTAFAAFRLTYCWHRTKRFFRETSRECVWLPGRV